MCTEGQNVYKPFCLRVVCPQTCTVLYVIAEFYRSVFDRMFWVLTMGFLLSGCCPGSSEDQTTPMLVTALKGLKVLDVACGSGDAQTLAVTENGEKNNTKYLW